MSENISLILMLMLGLGVGGLAVWLVARQKIKHEYDRAKVEFEADRATLIERLQGTDKQTRKLEANSNEQIGRASCRERV